MSAEPYPQFDIWLVATFALAVLAALYAWLDPTGVTSRELGRSISRTLERGLNRVAAPPWWQRSPLYLSVPATCRSDYEYLGKVDLPRRVRQGETHVIKAVFESSTICEVGPEEARGFVRIVDDGDGPFMLVGLPPRPSQRAVVAGWSHRWSYPPQSSLQVALLAEGCRLRSNAVGRQGLRDFQLKYQWTIAFEKPGVQELAFAVRVVTKLSDTEFVRDVGTARHAVKVARIDAFPAGLLLASAVVTAFISATVLVASFLRHLRG